MWCLLAWPRFFSWWSSVSRMAIRFFSSWSIKLLINITLMPLFSSFHILFPLPHLLCASVVGNISQHNSHNTVQSNCAPISFLYIQLCMCSLFPANLLSGSIVKVTEHLLSGSIMRLLAWAPPSPLLPLPSQPVHLKIMIGFQKKKKCLHIFLLSIPPLAALPPPFPALAVSPPDIPYLKSLILIIMTKLMIIMIMKVILLITSKSSLPSWWSWK